MSDQFLSWKALNVSKSGLLTSPSQHFDWRPREAAKAYCGYAHDLRELAYTDCSCGIYGVTDPQKALAYLNNYHIDSATACMAQIAQWGWLHEGSTGYRSEFAYPKQLIAPPYANKELLAMSGELYAIPVMYLDVEEWQTFTKQVVQHYTKTRLANVDMTQFTQAQILKAVRTERRHRLYMRIRNMEKRLQQLIAYQTTSLPRQIRQLETEIDAARREREAL
jgi:hypothetical protein